MRRLHLDELSWSSQYLYWLLDYRRIQAADSSESVVPSSSFVPIIYATGCWVRFYDLFSEHIIGAHRPTALTPQQRPTMLTKLVPSLFCITGRLMGNIQRTSRLKQASRIVTLGHTEFNIKASSPVPLNHRHTYRRRRACCVSWFASNPAKNFLIYNSIAPNGPMPRSLNAHYASVIS